MRNAGVLKFIDAEKHYSNRTQLKPTLKTPSSNADGAPAEQAQEDKLDLPNEPALAEAEQPPLRDCRLSDVADHAQ